RRIYMPARGTLVGGEDILLELMREDARDPHRPVVDILAALMPPDDLLQRRRLGGDPLLDTGDQSFLPVQALHLPGPEPDQDQQRRRDSGQEQQRRPQRTRGHHSTLPIRPCAALLAYCRLTRIPFDSRSASRHSTVASGTQSRIWTMSGGLRLTSSQSARPTMTKPMSRMTKTAGPSPESAKARSRPQLPQRRAICRKPEKSLPSPHRGHLPRSPDEIGSTGGYRASSSLMPFSASPERPARGCCCRQCAA